MAVVIQLIGFPYFVGTRSKALYHVLRKIYKINKDSLPRKVHINLLLNKGICYCLLSEDRSSFTFVMLMSTSQVYARLYFRTRVLVEVSISLFCSSDNSRQAKSIIMTSVSSVRVIILLKLSRFLVFIPGCFFSQVLTMKLQ